MISENDSNRNRKPKKDINNLFASMAGTPGASMKRDRINSDGFCDLADDEHLNESKE